MKKREGERKRERDVRFIFYVSNDVCFFLLALTYLPIKLIFRGGVIIFFPKIDV